MCEYTIHRRSYLDSLLDRDPDVLEEELRVNTVAPLYLLQKLLPSVRKGSAKKILLLSSCMGSIQNAPFFVGCTESYSITKAGINMYVHWSFLRMDRCDVSTLGSGASGARCSRRKASRLSSYTQVRIDRKPACSSLTRKL